MASTGDIVEEAAAEAAAPTPTRSRRTIYDYLGEGEDGEEDASASPAPARLRLPRFTCARIRFGRLIGGRNKRGGGRGGRKPDAETSEDARSCGGGGVVGGQTGVGLSMLFLLARTCVELNRMSEVRAQMEALLDEIRGEAAASASRVKRGDHVVLVTPRASDDDTQSSSSITAAATSSCCVTDTSTGDCLATRGGGGEDDDGERASEAELETEPECRCDIEQQTPDQSANGMNELARSDPLIFLSSVHSSSDGDGEDGEFIELEGGRFGTGGGDYYSQRGSAEEVDDDESCACRGRRHEPEGGVGVGVGVGVCAAELERRLHELQHRRDRERIAALESALRRARRELAEKEMEARLWQDTATLALAQPPTVTMPRDPDGRH